MQRAPSAASFFSSQCTPAEAAMVASVSGPCQAAPGRGGTKWWSSDTRVGTCFKEASSCLLPSGRWEFSFMPLLQCHCGGGFPSAPAAAPTITQQTSMWLAWGSILAMTGAECPLFLRAVTILKLLVVLAPDTGPARSWFYLFLFYTALRPRNSGWCEFLSSSKLSSQTKYNLTSDICGEPWFPALIMSLCQHTLASPFMPERVNMKVPICSIHKSKVPHYMQYIHTMGICGLVKPYCKTVPLMCKREGACRLQLAEAHSHSGKTCFPILSELD